MWYSFAGASAMTITGSSSGSMTANSTICPFGWTLPTTQQFLDILSNVAAFSPVYAGYYFTSGQITESNSAGIWWSNASSATGDVNSMLYSNNTGLLNQNAFRRNRGHFIRCVVAL